MENERFKLGLGGRELLIEIRNLAEKANGSVSVRYGDTVVFTTAVMGSEREEIEFFPLSVEYEEKYYAAGKILGSRFIRRETRPSDEAILTSRSIDRAIRPRFPEQFKKEIQIVATCLSYDLENDPDLLGLLGSSLSLGISDIPWQGPVAGVRIGKRGNNFILNPTTEEKEESDLDLVLTAIRKGRDLLINMVEGKANQVEKKEILGAVSFAKPYLQKLIDFQEQIIQKAGKEKIFLEPLPSDPELEKEIREFLGNRLENTLFGQKDSKRMESLEDLKQEMIYYVEGKYSGTEKTIYAKYFFEKEIERLVHQNALERGRRPDGRRLDQLREISCEAGFLPRTHGSGLFCRGDTKTLSILTLGAPGDVRLLEGMEIRGKKRFMHHYNFPPYSVGEVKPIRGPGRREIGHGILVEKALMALIPDFEQFPYTLRVVSEILSSNGSTSMASVSSTSLALMDAGVPLSAPAAGVALGLVGSLKKGKAGELKDYKILTDIQGPEDHHGYMDFKIAGTKKGITTLQMDVKIDGITEKIMEEALDQAQKARKEILEKMEKVLAFPRKELSPFAPQVYTLQIKPEKIREVIGPGGRVIHEIIEKCEVNIDIEDTGKIFITAEKEEAAKKAMTWIKNITREIRVGEIFQGKVKRIMDFGAFVEIMPGQEGLVHISQLAPRRVRKVEEVVKVGDIVPVKVISIDEEGRINLSIKETKK